MTLTYTRDYLDQTSVLEILDLQTKEYVRATSTFPFKSATREETIKEARANPALFESHDPFNIIELNGVAAEAKDSEWTTMKTRDRRSNLRRAASAQFLERLERLRSIVAKDPLRLFCAGLLRYVLYNEPCASSVTVTQEHGDCDFDALFHYACSDRQKGRLKDAIASGEPRAY